MDLLELCPFCGGPAKVINTFCNCGHNENIPETYVICKCCYARGPVISYYDYHEDDMRIRKAVEMWSYRPNL